MISAIRGLRGPSSWSVNVPFPVSMMCSWSALAAMSGTLSGAQTRAGTTRRSPEPTRVAPNQVAAAAPPHDQHGGSHHREGADDRAEDHRATRDEQDRQRQPEPDHRDPQPP